MAVRKKKVVARKKRRSAPRRVGEVRIDHVLVERTLELLGAHDREAGALERRVGAHLLDSYFGGDAELARSNSPAKAKSYGKLLDRATEETEWTIDGLRRAVNAEIAARSLPRSIADRVLPSYLSRLLAVDDPSKRVAVAEKIASGAVRGAEALALIVRESGGNPRGGRPRLPGPQKALGAMERSFAHADEGGELGVGEIRRIPQDGRRALATRYRALADRLREVASKIEASG